MTWIKDVLSGEINKFGRVTGIHSTDSNNVKRVRRSGIGYLDFGRLFFMEMLSDTGKALRRCGRSQTEAAV